MAFGQSLRLIAILAVIGFAAQVEGTLYGTLGSNRISLSSSDSPPASFEALRSDGTTQTMTCNSSSSSEAYPLDHMLDLDVNTRWQTENGHDTVDTGCVSSVRVPRRRNSIEQRKRSGVWRLPSRVRRLLLQKSRNWIEVRSVSPWLL